MTARRATALAAGLLASGVGAAVACTSPAPAVVSLEFGSRYVADDSTRSEIDTESNRAVNAALKPVDDFIRTQSRAANAALRNAGEEAECVLAALAAWAEADALSDLRSFNARLAVGGRLAGLAEVYRQIRPFVADDDRAQVVAAWLSRRATEQRDFWEKDATNGARNGNLRAWASLGIYLTGEVTGDDAARWWAYASAARILCTARPDGSLPMETGRGKWGLHYQFHAIAPLVAMAAHSEGRGPSLMGLCDAALVRAVDYALTDYDAGGAATQGYSGAVQSYFDGTHALEPHALAWLPAWMTLVSDPATTIRASLFERMNNSKLGGDQWLLWSPPVQ